MKWRRYRDAHQRASYARRDGMTFVCWLNSSGNWAAGRLKTRCGRDTGYIWPIWYEPTERAARRFCDRIFMRNGRVHVTDA